VGSLLCSDLKEELGGEVLGIVPYLGLPSGQRQFMIGEPVANARDLQRYKELLLEEQRELSSVQGDAAARVPAAGGLEGDLIDQANADAELQIRLHQTDARLLRAIEEALARIKQGTFGVCPVCKRLVSKVRLEAVLWTRLCRECKEREHSAA
jgi:RNA polymerase-binding transcription factor DksA